MRNVLVYEPVWLCITSARAGPNLPDGFVYLRDVDATIVQDVRYAGVHNFVGHQIAGYGAAECVLSREAATALVSRRRAR